MSMDMSFLDACRLCLKIYPDSVDVYSDDGLAQKLLKYFSISIVKEDTFPKNVCQLCIQEIEHFSEFSAKVEEVQKIIHDRISHIYNESARNAEVICKVPNLVSGPIKIELDSHVKNIKESDTTHSTAKNTHSENMGQEQVLLRQLLTTGVNLNIQNEQLRNTNSEMSSDQSHSSREFLVQCRMALNRGSISEIEKPNQNFPNSESNIADDDIQYIEIPEELTAADDSPLFYSSRDAELASFYTFSCELCKNGKKFIKYQHLDKHCEMEHNKRAVIICCGRELIGEYQLVRHMRKHSQYCKCPDCGKELSSQSALKCHMLSMHLPVEKRPFRCKHCPKGFIARAYLQSHEKIHLLKKGDLPYVCDACGKRFSHPNTLQSHQRHLHRSHSAMCHICAKTVVTQAALRQHMETHTSDSERVQCVECGKMLKNKNTMRTHMRVHKNKAFPCSQCGKVFKLLVSLRSHLLCHTNMWPHQCLVCKKSFKRKAGLQAHVVVHTGEKPYQCPNCSRTFASKSNYYSHKLRMHSSRKLADATT